MTVPTPTTGRGSAKPRGSGGGTTHATACPPGGSPADRYGSLLDT
jgi:hypothetical protein